MSRDTSSYIEELENSNISDEAFEFAADAISFVQTLWNLMKINGLLSDEDRPNFDVMEEVVDLLYGELHAAAALLSEDVFETLPSIFEGIADNLEKHNEKNGGVVPPEVIAGNRMFAARLKNASACKIKA